MKYLVCSIVLIFSLIQTGNAIHCYVCDDVKGSACDNPFDPNGVNVTYVECGVDQNKYKDWQCIETDLRIGSDRSVSRGCTPIIPNYDHCVFLLQQEVASHGIIKVWDCELCVGDGCNNKSFK